MSFLSTLSGFKALAIFGINKLWIRRHFASCLRWCYVSDRRSFPTPVPVVVDW